MGKNVAVISYPQSVDDCGFAFLFTGSELNSTTDNYLNDLTLCDKLLDSRREFPRDTLHAERFCKFCAVHRGSAELLQNFLTVFRIFVRRSLQKVRVNRNSYRKKTTFIVHFKTRHSGTVCLQSLDCIRKSCVSALNEFQFFKEITYPAVSVHSRTNAESAISLSEILRSKPGKLVISIDSEVIRTVIGSFS